MSAIVLSNNLEYTMSSEMIPDIAPTHTIQIDEKIVQLFKRQDHIITGSGKVTSTGESFQYLATFDGHGENYCIDFIRNSITREAMDAIMESDTPVQTLAGLINAPNAEGKYVVPLHNSTSGSTMCLVKIYTDRAVFHCLGDSRMMCIIDNECVFFSKEHKSHSNPEEKARVIAAGATCIPAGNIQVLTPTRITPSVEEYVCYPSNASIRLAMTRCLGHNMGKSTDALICEPEITTIPFTASNHVRILSGSDGFWDMILLDDEGDMSALRTQSCVALVDKVVMRWKQKWVVVLDEYPGKFFGQQFTEPREWDDVSLGLVTITPV